MVMVLFTVLTAGGAFEIMAYQGIYNEGLSACNSNSALIGGIVPLLLKIDIFVHVEVPRLGVYKSLQKPNA